MRKYVATRPPTGADTRIRPRRFVRRKPVERHRSLLGRIIVVLLLIVAVGVLALLAFKIWVDSQTSGLIYGYDDPNLPSNHVALVFGAGLNTTGGPSAILYDRVATAADIYKAGKVQKLLMTGDNSTDSYNEVAVMRTTAMQLGVPDKDIVLDYAGFSSWDSCYRAREVFSLQSATLVTQKFHLPRALYTCNQLDVKSVGVIADRQPYPTQYNELREYPALAATAWRLLINDQPRFLGPKVDVDADEP
ncbi:MAG TPA: ElyC/SanA/YdcF family protein [Chloroflexia bacterium]|nr:ElyC/SanA/YdcF family protein [Chloroflexia bacterium]